ncbi:Protein PAM68, chloroplastic [Apostasia shenzhenica]|uniref:Protein PAM68, chloroplastic n=1 Tax=Apostasia shenzhenica TaxID=1088818 RepID=A0A2H9ZQV8_9ASPA|nr:Protein PAM68, chloroplastic [Apostasia shenzhenica]
MGSLLLLLPVNFPRPPQFSSSSYPQTKTLIFRTLSFCAAAHLSRSTALKSTPRGFGPTISSQKSKKRKQIKKGFVPDNEEEEDEEDEEQNEGTIPEVVTNRMMRRMGLSIGIPLSIGLLFFPLFYYLKVVVKVDLPAWIPYFVSFFFFGASLLGVSYGIVSASWDPFREGSFLGWNEARRNWPVFWQSLWSGGGRK